MMLTRHANLEPMSGLYEGVAYPMWDGQRVVYAHATERALREAAARDHLPANLAFEELSEHYREQIESIASTEYGLGHWTDMPDPNPFRIVRVANGRL